MIMVDSCIEIPLGKVQSLHNQSTVADYGLRDIVFD